MRDATRRLERSVVSLRGFVMLYAYNTLSDSTIREMFEFEAAYDGLKRTMDPEGNFPKIIDKAKTH